MNRFVVAVAVCVTAMTQYAPAQESTPYIYFWGVPVGQDPSGDLLAHASQIVRVQIGSNDPETVADAVVDQAYDQIHSDPQLTDPTRLCILLQHFGEWNAVGADCSFLAPADALTPEPDWDEQDTDPMPYMQPWMTVGRVNVASWLADFIAEYDSYRQTKSPPVPIPVRVHFDTEVFMTGCCSKNYTRILESVYLDDSPVCRWDEVIVPGSGGKTMAELYEDAVTTYGWPDVPLFDEYAVHRDETPHSAQNRRYFLWYDEICRRAVDAVMEECAYSQIRAWGLAQEPVEINIVVSNYGDTNVDGEVDDSFGWFTGGSAEENHLGDLIPTREAVRGFTDAYGNEGARNIWLAFEGPERSRLWYTVPGIASGDVSAPYLYPVSPAHWGGGEPDFGYRLNYYLYDPYGPDDLHPEISIEDASLIHGRRWVESILNTLTDAEVEDPQLLIMPWVIAPETHVDWVPNWESPPYYHDVNHEEFELTLAMLRAKKIDELMVWWRDSVGQLFEWETMDQAMQYVYVPQLNDDYSVIGTALQQSEEADRLRFTLREADESEETVGVQAQAAGFSSPYVAGVQVRFDHLNPLKSPATDLILNLECSVEPAGIGYPSTTVGKVYVYCWVDDAEHDIGWVQLTDASANDFGELSGIGFFAPKNESGHTTWYETRRHIKSPELQANGFYVNGDGQMDIKIVFSKPALNNTFKVYFDLTQLIGAPGISTGPTSMVSLQGADYDYSEAVDEVDLVAFGSGWVNGDKAADFDNDGDIDQADYEAFVTAYNNP